MFYDIIKRVIDIFASLILAILFFPVWVIIPILQKLDYPEGPIFYFQERLGLNGRKFFLIKFRSMKQGADDFWFNQDEKSEKARKEGWKMTLKEDTRITRLGKIIRQTSIDEFPQILNILKGDMSLVGPRPIRPVEFDDAVKRYGPQIKKVIEESLSVKPGLSGPWQVSGRNDIPWNQRVYIDANYANRKSILYDIFIILKTPFAMISKW